MLGIGTVARVAKELRRDVAVARDRDPAARGVGPVEIVATWPGIQALLSHRVAHALHASEIPLLPRAIALVSRALTGIEIHPAADIGKGLFIDHGSGVVIGETAQIGHGAKIGANSVVITDVPPNSTVVGNPGHPVRIDGRRPEGPDADWIHLPDPIAEAIQGLASRIGALERAVAELSGGEAEPPAEVR